MDEKLERLLAYRTTNYVMFLPSQYQECSFQNFDWTDQKPGIWGTILNFIEDKLLDKKQRPFKGLFLFGSFGVGKSHLLAGIYRVIAAKLEDVSELQFIEFAELIDGIKHRFGETGASASFEQIFKSCDYLFLDDITSTRMTEFSIDILEKFIQYRYSNGLRTCITSQFGIEKLDFLSFHARSRLFEMCVPLEIKGRDRRLE